MRESLREYSQASWQQKRRSRSAKTTRVAGISVLLIVLAVAIALASGWFWLRHAMSAALPQIDGEAHLAGLSAGVTVRRDAHGVPHIEAASLDDLLEAQGYVTAQDRLWQMDMARRLSAGEAAEILGSKLVDHDTAQRVFAFRATAERIVSTLPADQLHQIEAYARGVNHFIDDHQDDLPAEFRVLRYKPKPWRPLDTILVALSMAQTLMKAGATSSAASSLPLDSVPRWQLISTPQARGETIRRSRASLASAIPSLPSPPFRWTSRRLHFINSRSMTFCACKSW